MISPRISAIIPTYNAQRFLPQAIQSAIDQQLRPVEILVIDDGSSDKTEEIVREFASPVPIRYLRQSNQGPSVARNLGVSLSQGDWVAFLDSDDMWHQRKLAEQVALSRSNPNIRFIHCDITYVNAAGVPMEIDRPQMKAIQLFFGEQPIPKPSTVMMRKDLFYQAGGFDPRIRLGEDVLLFAKSCLLSKPCFLPQSLVFYRIHDHQLHRNSNAVHDWILALEGLESLTCHIPPRRALLRHELGRYYSDLGRQLSGQGKNLEARDAFWHAFRARPFYWKNLRRLGMSYLSLSRKPRILL